MLHVPGGPTRRQGLHGTWFFLVGVLVPPGIFRHEGRQRDKRCFVGFFRGEKDHSSLSTSREVLS